MYYEKEEKYNSQMIALTGKKMEKQNKKTSFFILYSILTHSGRLLRFFLQETHSEQQPSLVVIIIIYNTTHIYLNV
jgi:hypothetical protein